MFPIFWQIRIYEPAADRGFPVGGGGGAPPTRALFGGNVCENERIGSCWWGATENIKLHSLC